MLSRQESLLSSSRRQAAAATPPPSETHQAKAIGCMSGIIHLFSKYQNRNKRLTFGRKQAKCKPSSPPQAKGAALLPTKDSISSPKQDKTEKQMSSDTTRLLLSRDSDVPRSPMIPAEIRRSNAVNPSESPRTPSSLVARLMGLEDITIKRPIFEVDPITEKRRRLLQALEKCNEDLESLKKIIQAVQSPDTLIQPSQAAEKKTCMEKRIDVGAAHEELSPVCVLDEFSRSPTSPSRFSKLQNASGLQRSALQHCETAACKKPCEDNEPIAKNLYLSKYSTTAEYASLFRMRRQAAVPWWSSRAMIKSVDEVCNDIAWGEEREARRIGLVLQDYLCKDLVEELVQELKSCCINYHPLPLQGCKRRLCF